MNRPGLESFFTEGTLKDKAARDERIFEAVERYG